ncbi:transcriptional regulator, TetR family [Desulfobulbus propionicus DSM 2032]|uniref:Transcriptional regulator, TetR family n=1 Tax=Desulfobulbus propionicus (strain ATCC 33891 / DSM 2032 / VKM B-1956 / 1pr3) TaxID=577650 RepID=A0A7U3YLG3_DESPD|nr:TetR/AcrR family transcriptional regulator [Desulfobulbus propionicus]ADW17554.1 transcriptional regulator, TetR family [Desulfobulbus propionicus DSM 2032]
MFSKTKEHILACGGEIIHHKGFNATGLQEILHSAGVPKGSFYFYFKSKDDFGLALIDHYREQFAEQLRPVIKDDSLSPVDRLQRFFLWFHDHFAASGYIKGCPIGNLIQEMGDIHPAFREKLHDSLERLIAFVRGQLELAHEQQLIPSHLDPDATARFIISAWQGALIRMKAVAGPEPLENFHSMIFSVLLR